MDLRPPETRRSETFTALNGLRFLAALAVVVFHYAPRVAGYAHVPSVAKNLIDEGPCAVSFFFILSGFVLGYRHLYGGSRPQAPLDFYWDRFVRLYPAYLLAFFLFLPIAVQRLVLHPSPASATRHTFLLSAVLSALMLQSWTPLALAWNGPSWSLSVEAFMYLVFPIFAARLAKLSRRATLIAVFASWLIPSTLAAAYSAHWIPVEAWRLYVTNNPLLWTPLFLMGICASRWIPAWQQVSTRRARNLTALAFIALVIVLVIASLARPHRWADVFVTGGIAPLLLVVIVCSTRHTGWVTKSLGSPLLNKLGGASYVVYILQAPLWHYWQPLTNYLRRAPLQSNIVAFWQFAAYLPFLVLVSLAVQTYVEAPVRGWLKKRKARSSSALPSRLSPPQASLQPSSG